jgi:hypothetical protein
MWARTSNGLRYVHNWHVGGRIFLNADIHVRPSTPRLLDTVDTAVAEVLLAAPVGSGLDGITIEMLISERDIEIESSYRYYIHVRSDEPHIQLPKAEWCNYEEA